MPDAETRSSGPGVTSALPSGLRALVVTPPPVPPGPDVSGEPDRYRAWVAHEDERHAGAQLADGPTVALVVVGHGPGGPRRQAFVDSVLAQRYRRWVVFTVGDGATRDGATHDGARRPARRRRGAGRRVHEVPCAVDAPEALAAHVGVHQALSAVSTR